MVSSVLWLSLCLPSPVRAGDDGRLLLAVNTAVMPGLSPAELSRFFDHAPIAHAPPPPDPVPPVPGAYARTFRRLLAQPRRTGRYDRLIAAESSRRGLDARLVKAIIAAESEFTARAKSPAGALGLMQVMPATAEYMGVRAGSLFAPPENVRAGTAYLAHLFARAWKRYALGAEPFLAAPRWLLERVVAAYNAGPRFLAKRKLYRETREYVRKVLLYYDSEVSRVSPS